MVWESSLGILYSSKIHTGLVLGSLTVSDNVELLKKFSTLNPAMLDNFLFMKHFYITNRDYTKGKKHFGTQSLPVVHYLFKASQVGVLSNLAAKAHEDLLSSNKIHNRKATNNEHCILCGSSKSFTNWLWGRKCWYFWGLFADWCRLSICQQHIWHDSGELIQELACYSEEANHWNSRSGLRNTSRAEDETCAYCSYL